MFKRQQGISAALIAATLVLGACDDDDEVAAPSTDDIVDIAVATAEVSTLTAAVEVAGLVPTLRGDGPYTVFAPVNSAFDALGADVVTSLLESENADLLTEVLTFHVVAAEAFSANLTDGQTVTTLQGEELTIGVTSVGVTVNGANVTTADIEASNGVIHLIDAVLVPEADIVDVAILNGFETLVDLVRAAGLEDTLRSDNGGAGFTVFAPTDDAFAALSAVPTGGDLVEVLTYHVVGATVESGDLSDGQVVTTAQGGTFTVNIDGSDVTITDGSGATVSVIVTDVPASNGVIHVIDGVMLPS